MIQEYIGSMQCVKCEYKFFVKILDLRKIYKKPHKPIHCGRFMRLEANSYYLPIGMKKIPHEDSAPRPP